MANIKKKVEKLETRVSELELRTDRVITKLDMFIAESREARQRQDADMREAREKHEADIQEMRPNIDGMSYHLRSMTIATAIGYAAMVVAVFLK